MNPEDVPEELVTLFKRSVDLGASYEEALSRVLTLYDEMYTKKMNEFFLSWDNGWNYGLDTMPDSGAAPVPPILREQYAKPETARKMKGVRITFPGDPDVVKTYSSVAEAAKGEFISVTVVRGRLNGMYTKRRKINDPIYEWSFVEIPKILRVIYPSGKVNEYSSVRDAADALRLSPSKVYDKLNGRYNTQTYLGELRFEWIGLRARGRER